MNYSWNADAQEIPEEARRFVLRRDFYTCQCCGNADPDQLTLHHILYRSHGGRHTAENLVTLCSWCHRDVHDGRLFVKRIGAVCYFRRGRPWS